MFTYKNRRIHHILNTAWKKARLRAGLKQVRVHDLKHTFGRRLRAAGALLHNYISVFQSTHC